MKTTDTTLRDAVVAALDWDDHVETVNIGVIANDGAVTLTGFVRSPIEHRAAIRAAEHVPGVAVVADQLEVRPPGSPARSDAEIASDIARERHWHPFIPASLIVHVKDGHVTLTGEVDSRTQRREAEDIFRGIRGVRGITNAIDVRDRPDPDPREVERRADDAIRSMADTDARSIRASIEDGTVRLEGTVRTAAERELAERAAEGVAGVTAVVNEIVVTRQEGAN